MVVSGDAFMSYRLARVSHVLRSFWTCRRSDAPAPGLQAEQEAGSQADEWPTLGVDA